MDLNQLQEKASECRLCELYNGRIKPVFARGNPESGIIVCGMCPGPDENKVGYPFVGVAGKVLNKVLLKAYGGSNFVYITNLVKCFVHPGLSLNSNWMNSCLPYFLVQIKLINPKVIITLGADVTNFLLNTNNRIGEMRGKVFDYLNLKLIATYHPSYLARGGGEKHRHFMRVVNDFSKALPYTEGDTYYAGLQGTN